MKDCAHLFEIRTVPQASPERRRALISKTSGRISEGAVFAHYVTDLRAPL